MDKAGINLLPLLLYKSKNHTINGITRLEKLLFLLVFEEGLRELYDEFDDYKPYNFGPFSAKAMDYLELLNDEGIIAMEIKPITKTHYEYCSNDSLLLQENDDQTNKRIHIYSLTDDGVKIGKFLYDELSHQIKEKLDRLIARYSMFSTDDLIKYVYTNYDEYTTESKIREQVLGKSPEEEFREKHPGLKINTEFFTVIGILPSITLEKEKEKLRTAAIERLQK